MLKVKFLALILASFFVSPLVLAETARETPVVKVIKEASPAVVNISTERLVRLESHPFWGPYGNLFDQYFNDYNKTVIGTFKTQNLGSGVLVSKDGLLVTNAHVVNMANKVFVTLQSGESYEARLLGTDVYNDIALLKIDAGKNLPALRPAKDALLGETVVAIGSPFGLQNSVSSGIISGIKRNFGISATGHVFKDLIQTDAPINPGNSGGALINLEGELAGINLAVVENAQNIGFAISSGKIQNMLDEYEKVKESRILKIKESF